MENGCDRLNSVAHGEFRGPNCRNTPILVHFQTVTRYRRCAETHKGTESAHLGPQTPADSHTPAQLYQQV